MLNLLQALVERLRPQPLDPAIEQQLSRAVDRIDPRLKAFGNYPRAYRPAITLAMVYVAELVARLPPPIDLASQRYAQDPLLHALFTDAAGIGRSVCDSSAIREFSREDGGQKQGEWYALMTMRRHEKTVFGGQLSGAVMQPDVQQTLVYFDSHTLTLVSDSLDGLHQQIQEDLLDNLIDTFRDQVERALSDKHELELRRDTLSARLRGHSGKGTDEDVELPQLREAIGRLDEEYALSEYGRLLTRFMASRRQYLSLEQVDIPIDMRGVKRQSDERLAGEFAFFDLVGHDRRRLTLCPVRLLLAELPGCFGQS